MFEVVINGQFLVAGFLVKYLRVKEGCTVSVKLIYTDIIHYFATLFNQLWSKLIKVGGCCKIVGCYLMSV